MRKTSDIMLVLTKQTDTDYENYTDKMREEIDEFEKRNGLPGPWKYINTGQACSKPLMCVALVY